MVHRGLLYAGMACACMAAPLARPTIAPASHRGASRLLPKEQPRQQPAVQQALGLRGGAGELAELDADTFTWNESLPWLRYVRSHGVAQFVSVLRKMQHVTGDELLWGDEIEYHIFALNESLKTAKLSLRAPELLKDLRDKEEELSRRDGLHIESCAWHPEYGGWMVEGTPRVPYGGFTHDLARVEANMRLRRKRLVSQLKDGEIAVTMPAFPLMGAEGITCTQPAYPAGGPTSESDSVPDELITPIPRFHTLTRNIRARRGSKVSVDVPVYADAHTVADTLSKGIHMDAMAFGMGCCCLQVTFQARDIDESRHLYDHLAVLSPIMLALTAATPILKGLLADTDVRWSVVAGAVDDRTPAERGEVEKAQDAQEGGGSTVPTPEQLQHYAGCGVKSLPKSRYESISHYLANCSGCQARFNDLNAPIDEPTLAMLEEAGIDSMLARHIAHLFTRDPLVIYKERLHLDDQTQTDHWESLQSTNWQTVRWKPPPRASPKPCGPHIGWRVEFRSMEVQLTDFENAALTVFVVLASRVILAFDLNLYMPLSKVDENMARAHTRDAATSQKFWFRAMEGPNNGKVVELSIQEILAGKEEAFPGLIPLIFAYLDQIDCEPETLELLRAYMSLLLRRASGELLTPAAWMRKFVMSHPEYKHDSIVPESVAHDLVKACADIGEGRRHEASLLGGQRIRPIVPGDAWPKPLTAPNRLSFEHLSKYRIQAQSTNEHYTMGGIA